MIEGIKEIGNIILSEAPKQFLESLVLNVPSEKKKQHIVIIEFDTEKEIINFDFNHISEETTKRYLWIDVAKGNKPQIYLTTKSFRYLFTKTLQEINNYKYPTNDKEIQSFKKVVKKICNKFFVSKKGIIDVEKFSFNGEFLVDKIASRLEKVFNDAVGKLKRSKTKKEKKELLRKLFGKESDPKKYLPDRIFKRLKQQSEEVIKKDLAPNTSFVLKKEELRNFIKDKFTDDIKKMSKSGNLDESKLSLIKAMCEEGLPDYKEIGLVSLKISEDDYTGNLVDHPGYRKMLECEKIEQIFDLEHIKKEYREKIFEGICNLCGRKSRVSSNTTNLKLKFYMTDKVGFSNDLKGNFLGNYALCKSCYKDIMAGEVFIMNNFRTQIGGISVYIIPKFIFNIPFSMNKLKKWSEYINISFNSTTTLNGLKNFQDSLEDYLEFEKEKNNFILNILFYRKAQSEMKVLKLIKDVPPSRLDILKDKENEVHDIGAKLLGENDRWYLNLEKMYYLFPIRISKNKVVDYKKLLDFYDSLFASKPISYKFLIQQFVELACVYKFDNYNIRKTNSDLGLVYATLEANLLLLYLRKLNLLEGGETMDVEELNLSSEMKEYIKEKGYSEYKTALFLLGYLIGEVGNVQWMKGKSKPILNKITYQGMNVRKLLRLTNEVFEKLKQYKKLSYNEQIFREITKLFEKFIDNWKLSDQENVFYVLSGYAYSTCKALSRGEQKELSDKQKEGGENE